MSRTDRSLNLSHYGLDGFVEGKPTVLYHGTTASFSTFNLRKSRGELVDGYYGKGIFFTPSRRVAMKYAKANRNVGLPVSVIADLSRHNPAAGAMLRALYKYGRGDGWEVYAKRARLLRRDGSVDYAAVERRIGVDPNLLADVSAWVIGAASQASISDDGASLFAEQTGMPHWVYDDLDKLGLDSARYRPKVYTVSVVVKRPLVTEITSLAKRARALRYDSIIFHGDHLVGDVPEVAVFDPRKVKILHVEVIE